MNEEDSKVKLIKEHLFTEEEMKKALSSVNVKRQIYTKKPRCDICGKRMVVWLKGQLLSCPDRRCENNYDIRKVKQ